MKFTPDQQKKVDRITMYLQLSESLQYAIKVGTVQEWLEQHQMFDPPDRREMAEKLVVEMVTKKIRS